MKLKQVTLELWEEYWKYTYKYINGYDWLHHGGDLFYYDGYGNFVGATTVSDKRRYFIQDAGCLPDCRVSLR